MSDGGKIESKIIIYSVNRGNKYNQMENERTALIKMNHVLATVAKVGAEKNLVSTQIVYSSQ